MDSGAQHPPTAVHLVPDATVSADARRRLPISLALVCLISAAGLGWLTWQEFRRPTLALIANPLRMDMGALPKLQNHAVEFRLTNAGTLPMEFLSVQSSCTCTATRLDHARLERGESTGLRAVVSTGAEPGPLSSQIAIVFRATGSSTTFRQVLEIVGTATDAKP